MQSGTLTVTGEGKTEIPLRGWPREVVAYFKPTPDPNPCDHHHPHHDNRDRVSHHIRHDDEDRKKHARPGHHHDERKFFLELKWKVVGVREILWFVFY